MITKMSLVSLMYQISNLIADERYGDILSICNHSKIDENGIRNAITEYPATFTSPPKEAYPTSDDDIIEIENVEVPTWDICLHLWTLEEGRSDLCVMLDCIEQNDRLEVTLRGIYVP